MRLWWARAIPRAQVTTITDNNGVWRELRGLLAGRQAKSVHQADWEQVARRIHRLREVKWAKAHVGLSRPVA